MFHEVPIWFTILLMILAAIFGIYCIPRLEIPSLGEKYLYLSRQIDKNKCKFYVLSDYPFVVHPDRVHRIGFFRYIINGEVSIKFDQIKKEYKVESQNLEITKNLELEEEIKMLRKENKRLRRMLEKGAITFKTEDVKEVITGGGK